MSAFEFEMEKRMNEIFSRKLLNLLRILTATSLVAVLAACSHHSKAGSHDKLLASETTSDIGINAYLWRAALETLDFMPIASTDAKGGVLVTDWYSNPQTPAERVKVTVYITDKRLRADGVKVTVNRQWMQGGLWVDQPDKYESAVKIQEAILMKARYIRLSLVPE
jgi:uncharacterized lipoprotein